MSHYFYGNSIKTKLPNSKEDTFREIIVSNQKYWNSHYMKHQQPLNIILIMKDRFVCSIA